MGELLKLCDVTKLYKTSEGKEAVGVQHVSFTVDEGEFISIIGPSGCGKSTLLRCIAGFEKINDGNIYLDGTLIKKPGPDRFMIFQGLDQLFPWLTLKQNIAFAMKAVKAVKSDEIMQRAQNNLELVGLSGFGDYYPYQLSGGMKQRASIARALSVGPKVLLMDEPFGSLDAFSRKAMHHMLLKVWNKTKVTIIFVTHDIEEAIDLSDRIIAFAPGCILADIKNPLERPRVRETALYRNFFSELNGIFETNFKGIDLEFERLSAKKAKLISV